MGERRNVVVVTYGNCHRSLLLREVEGRGKRQQQLHLPCTEENMWSVTKSIDMKDHPVRDWKCPFLFLKEKTS